MTTTDTFRKYDHLERLGHRDVEGILNGKCYVFPKIDGTNGSVWSDELGQIWCASRNRVLTKETDNHGFHAWVNGESGGAIKLRVMAQADSSRVFYGEWLVPHTIKSYRDENWRRFWIFDVYDRDIGKYLDYEECCAVVEFYDVDHIPPACTVTDPSEEQLRDMLDHNVFLMQEGSIGEGVVIKNYSWINLYDRQPWAKLVRNEFKEKNAAEFGHGERKGRLQKEIEIADAVVTEALCRKELAKIEASIEGSLETNRKTVIPRILSTVYRCVITEELWDQLKKHRNPTLDFKALNGRVVYNIKRHLSDLF